MLIKEQQEQEYVCCYFDSSNILRIRYCDGSQTMEVVFGKGQEYRYSDVPRYMWLRIRNAPSQGKIFDELIKKQGRGKEIYSEEKIGTVSGAELKQIKKTIDDSVRG